MHGPLPDLDERINLEAVAIKKQLENANPSSQARPDGPVTALVGQVRHGLRRKYLIASREGIDQPTETATLEILRVAVLSVQQFEIPPAGAQSAPK